MNKKIVFIIISFLALQINVWASNEVTLSISCDKNNLLLNDTATCELKANAGASYEVNGASMDIIFGSDLEVILSSTDDFTGILLNNHITITGDTSRNDTFTIGILSVKMISNTDNDAKKIDFKNITFSNSTNVYNASSFTKQFLTLSTVNTLSSLKVNGSAVSTPFDGTKTSYEMSLNASKATIEATGTDTKSTISGTGEKALNYGKNTFTIKVVSESGATKSYTLVINRPDNRSKDNTLKSLKIGDDLITLKSGVLEYSLNVSNSVEKLTILAVTNDKNATFAKDYGNRDENIAYGENKVEIKVKAENGTEKTYVVKITREDLRNDTAELSSLVINNQKIDLKSGVYEYNLLLRYKHTKTQVTAFATQKGTVEFTDMDLVVGDNDLLIKVISEKESTKEYKIKIKRLTQEESKVIIENIVIKNYNINFNKDIKTYNLKVDKDVNKLEFSFFPDEEELKYTILGNNNLENGSIITINVKDDVTEYIYTINIEKEVNDLIFGFLTINLLCYIVFGIGIFMFLFSIIHAVRIKKHQ